MECDKDKTKIKRRRRFSREGGKDKKEPIFRHHFFSAGFKWDYVFFILTNSNRKLTDNGFI
jgi:hypothetical protein